MLEKMYYYMSFIVREPNLKRIICKHTANEIPLV